MGAFLVSLQVHFVGGISKKREGPSKEGPSLAKNHIRALHSKAGF